MQIAVLIMALAAPFGKDSQQGVRLWLAARAEDRGDAARCAMPGVLSA